MCRAQRGLLAALGTKLSSSLFSSSSASIFWSSWLVDGGALTHNHVSPPTLYVPLLSPLLPRRLHLAKGFLTFLRVFLMNSHIGHEEVTLRFGALRHSNRVSPLLHFHQCRFLWFHCNKPFAPFAITLAPGQDADNTFSICQISNMCLQLLHFNEDLFLAK